METIGMAKSYQDSSTGNIPTSSDDETSSHRPAFQRCHRLQARLEAVSAGLCELNMLRERQEQLVMEAMCLPLSCVEDGEEKEEDKRKSEERKEADFGNVSATFLFKSFYFERVLNDFPLTILCFWGFVF